ncbi:CYFA0S13e02036g1_1 [Cyberlindnera fabianii]|uniref:Dolichyl-phosphate-mannose--protein mannosyltransferase n=1 Tax=Cyberlindnera fabianii TaxID=36022 RepID=A0A061BAU4_CYBFA|nr:CYFA0S13e02036g1_1 [Cyberlindnera fabianii]
MAKKVKESASARASAAAKAKASEEPVPKLQYKQGDTRPFLVTTPDESLSQIRSVHNNRDRIYLALLALTSLLIRVRKISDPDSVVFDEVHFGGFASKYIKGNFFMDVHPPLAKMLYAGIASLGGFTGDFMFEKIGTKFPQTVPYVLMRAFPAFVGVATVILMFLTLKASGVRSTVAFLTSVMFIFENAYVTISRYILLDAPLMFFIASAAYGYKRFQNEVPFTFKWYKALISTGVALGLAVSSKWVGLFTIAWVGLLNVWDLWFMIGDLSVSVPKIFKQTASRAIVLLGVPLTLYLAFFAIHFNILTREGDGSPFMSSAFRATLQGNKIPRNILKDVGVGSKVTLRHVATQGGYLHSHDHMYETGSKQQQITLYPHLDSNNNWLIELYNVSEAPTSFEQITDGTKIRLKHQLTGRRLHSHDHKCPVTENDWQKEVTCYGYQGFGGDANDDFVVEIQKAYTSDVAAQKNLTALRSVFRLRHAMTGCYLFSHEVKLPKWGFEQQEVTCATQGVVDKSLWYIETNENQFLPPDAERINYPVLSFFDKLIESHKRMWHINNGLNSPHAWESAPSTWPYLLRGINYWGEPNRQIYLFGNAPIWWSVTLSVFAFGVYVVIQILRWHLGAAVGSDEHVFNFNVQTVHYLLGWLLHFAPSFLMGRQMFLHHYLPAYYFGILSLGHFFDILVTYVFSKKRPVAYGIIGSFTALVVLFFAQYSPLVYGSSWTKSACEASQLLSGWDYDCRKYA